MLSYFRYKNAVITRKSLTQAKLGLAATGQNITRPIQYRLLSGPACFITLGKIWAR